MFGTTSPSSSPSPLRHLQCVVGSILVFGGSFSWVFAGTDDPKEEMLDVDYSVIQELDGAISCNQVQRSAKFELETPWGYTATNPPPRHWGDPCTLTWGFISDGTAIPASDCSGPASPSNLIAFLDSIHGSGPGGNDYTLRPWFPLFQQVFDSWGALNGINYLYEPVDDGSPFPTTSGALGVRADLRIGGHYIDGEPQGVPNTLACNYYPNSGDMIIDTTNPIVFSNSANNYLWFRNVLAHEHGHGMGMNHSCPADNTKLMEPTLNDIFDGPQYDDVLGSHRMYGDSREFPASADDLQAGAFQLGYISEEFGGTRLNRSIDNAADVDWHSFIAPAGVELTIIVDPDLSDEDETYPAGPQNEDGSCSAGTPFDGTRQSDLAFDLYDPSGALLESVDEYQHASEAIIAYPLPGDSGTYTIKVYGDEDAAQRYSLYAQFSCLPDAWEPDDDTWDLSTGLIPGSSQDHSICPTGDQDWFGFYLSDPSGITIETSVLGGSGPTIELLDEYLNPIELNQLQIDRVCGVDELASGSYLVKITEDTGTYPIAAYAITLDVTSCVAGVELSVTTSGNGSGVVTSDPSGINCGSDCSETFPPETEVTLTAAADAGSAFTGWTGHSDCVDGVVIMTTDVACNAVFSPADIFVDGFESGDTTGWSATIQ